MNSIHPKKFMQKFQIKKINRVCPSSHKAQSGFLGPLGELMLWQSRTHTLSFEGGLVRDLKNKHPKFFLMSL